MRKLLIFMLMVASLQVSGGQTRYKTVNFSFSVSDFKMETTDGLTRVHAPELAYCYDTDTLMPMLPKIAVNVLLGPDEDVLGFSHSLSAPAVVSQVTMEGCQLPVPTDADSTPAIRPAQSSVSPFVTHVGTDEFRGYRIAGFVVCPFAYNATTGVLSLSEDWELTLNLGPASCHGAGVQSEVPGAWACDTTRLWLDDIVSNYTDVDSLYSDVNINIVPANKRYQYLIITNNALKPQFQRLADWKNTKGVRTKVMTVEDISQQYPSLTPQKQVKSAIMAMRDSTHGALRYVLLGGDETVVPVQMAYVEATDDKDYTHTALTPCDLYYASLKELEWDASGNGVAGELEDSVSLFSDVDLTRMPVADINDAHTQITRVIDYELKPHKKPWNSNILMTGVKISTIIDHTAYGDSISDSHNSSEHLYSFYLEGNWSGSRVRFYDTGTDFPGDADYDVTAVNLQTELSKGYPFVHVSTHGSPQAWRMESLPSYSSSHAANLQNVGYSTILTSACNTGQFDDSQPCLAESFLNNCNSGIVAYLGNSRLGWTTNSNFNLSLLRSVFKRQLHLGSSLRFMKNSQHFFVNKYDSMRWILLSLNGFGDAELPLYISKSQRFDNMTFHYRSGNLTVNEHVDSCQTCVMSMDDMGQSYYSVKKNVNGTWNRFEGLTEAHPYSVCITRNGFVPFVAQVHQSFFMQDESLQSDEELFIIAQEASIGKHVTDGKPQGEVVIAGNMTVMCSGSVLIDKGTSIAQGAKFEIKLNR